MVNPCVGPFCFFLQVLLPTLSEFSAQMRAKAAQSMIGTVDWPPLLSLSFLCVYGSSCTPYPNPITLFQQVLLPALSEFSSQLRAKAAQSMIGTADWALISLASSFFLPILLNHRVASFYCRCCDLRSASFILKCERKLRNQ